MIQLDLGVEPPELTEVRSREVSRVGALVAAGRNATDVLGDRYAVVKDELRRRQHLKCAYCEAQEQAKRNDVEHFRPKSRYWWLAWTWDNLVFACRNCNQAPFKLDKFPLEVGSIELAPGEQAPGHERPLLLDPRHDACSSAIQFVPSHAGGWKPIARNGSRRGETMIRTCGLARPDLIDLYSAHVKNHVQPVRNQIENLARTDGREHLRDRWRRATAQLLAPEMPFVGLSHDALDFFFPEAWRVTHQVTLQMQN